MAGQSKNRSPVALAGIRAGGASPDGKVVQFAFDAHDGKTFAFSVPHEAIAEIVQALLTLGDVAAKRRPPPTFEPGASVQVRPFPLQGFETSHLPDGTTVLTLKSRNWMTHSLALEPQSLRSLVAELETAIRRTSN